MPNNIGHKNVLVALSIIIETINTNINIPRQTICNSCVSLYIAPPGLFAQCQLWSIMKHKKIPIIIALWYVYDITE